MQRRRTRNPRGAVVLNKRANGDDVWRYRWRDEIGRQKSVIFATKKEFKTATLAWNEAERQRLPERYLLPVQNAKKGTTFGQLVERYKAEKMPQRFSTRHGYENWLNRHIVPQWGATLIPDIDPGAVELWLSDMELAPKSKAHIRGLMAVLFDEAMKWKLLPISRNPMELIKIRGASRRRSRPRILAKEQFGKLLAAIEEDYVKVVSMVSMCLGLRFSEALGLQWQDVDWGDREIRISRAIVQGRVGDVKTECSEAPAPLDPELAFILSDWQAKAKDGDPGLWVFASPDSGYRQPYFPTGIRRKIHAAARRAGLGDILVGEPTKVFRHSYRAWLGATNAPVGVIKDLMRHADIRTTFNVYGNGMADPMREANSKVVRFALPGRKKSG